jgi:uncharacterized membrane protein YdjX (TVP38/TMEM64 family)
MSRHIDHDEAMTPANGPIRWLRLTASVLLALILLAVAGLYATGWHRELSLEALVRHRATIAALVADHRLAALMGFIAFYAVAAGSSLPGVVLLTIGAGAVFGAALGGLAAIIGATAGATGVFLIARSAIGTALARRAGPLAKRFAKGFRDDAFNYLLFMRLVPVFPIWLVNVMPALCGVRLATYVAATAIGVVPMTLAFAFFGAGLDSVLAAEVAQYRACLAAGGADCQLAFDITTVMTPQLVLGLVALGLAALIPVALRRWRARRPRDPS